MAFNGGDNKGSKLSAWPELAALEETKAEAKNGLTNSDPISAVLDELDFQDAMKRSIILGICTRLVNGGNRTKADLALEIKHHGAVAFLTANMEQPAGSSEAISVRDTTSRLRPVTGETERPFSSHSTTSRLRRPTTGELDAAAARRASGELPSPNIRKASSTTMVRPSAEAIAEAQRAFDEEIAAKKAEKPLDGDTLMARIKEKLNNAAETLGFVSGSEKDDKEK